MDFLTTFRRQVRGNLFVLLLLNNAILLGLWVAADEYLPTISKLYIGAALGLLALIVTVAVTLLTASYITKPIATIWQAIQHVAPDGDEQPAPNLNQRQLGHELVATLANHVYQLASVVKGVEQTTAKSAGDLHRNFVANSLPLPLIVLNNEEQIVYVNDLACVYLGKPATDLENQNVYTALDMSFMSSDTLSSWLKRIKGNAAVADNKWERVRIGLPGQGDSLLFDMAGYYNQANSFGYEIMLVLFDHTEVYAQDDQSMSFVALSVHELRTPLTLLRGYIEVFDEELGPGLSVELKTFMKKMDASAQQLAAFVDNILNVAKIEDNQLTLQLHEEQWEPVVASVVQDMALRAGVRGITIKTDIAPGLPTVGVDRYSIYEVIANLLDNAIKYSKGTSEIYISSKLDGDGLVETSVKDFGLGIETSILPHIFGKFYRNHRNRSQIGGTGLGLYLCKSIVDAHGGTIMVNSKVNEGSTFTFTLLPYAQLEGAGKAGTKSAVTRSAHGWIKNHALYRD